MTQDWHAFVSQPQYTVKTEKNAFITMPDGVRLAADVYRPDAGGTFPALLSYSPYSKEFQKLPVPPYQQSTQIGNGGIEAGDTDFFVSRGYVHVIVDARGTGDSEGAYGWFSKTEQEDGYHIVEWIAAQPWCSGNVGMLGMSYFAMIQYLVAAQNPPHLKAIFPYDPTTDMYRQWNYPGGILAWGFNFQWWPHVPVHTFEPLDLPADDLRMRIDEAKNNPDIRRVPNVFITTMIPEKNVFLFDALAHPHDGPFYWERSAYTKFDQIKVPTYLGSRWNIVRMHLPGAIDAFEKIQAPKKLFIELPGLGQTRSCDQAAGSTAERKVVTIEDPLMAKRIGKAPARPWTENQDVILRWYDHWLKGIDTGIMNEPPVRIFVQGINQWRHEHEWPLARTRWTRFYLRQGGVLSEAAPTSAEEPDSFTNAPTLLPGQKAPALIYETPPLDQDVELTGPAAVYLQAALSTLDAHWQVELYDADTDGSARFICQGLLRASHREIDESRSRPCKPFHPHTRSVPVEPGAIVEYPIELCDNSNVFLAGHKIRLVVRGQDDVAPWGQLLPNSQETVQTVYHDKAHQSYALLPVIP